MKTNIILKIFISAIFIFFWGVRSSLAAQYFVDPYGSDNNDGRSTTNAWQTVNQVNNYNNFQAGDVISFKSGGNWDEVLIPKSGSQTNSITYNSYGGTAKPTLDSVNASGKSYVKIQGLSFNSNTTAIDLSQASYVIIDGNDIHGSNAYWQFTIRLYNNSHHNQITNNNITQSAGENDTINLRGNADHNLIMGNTITVDGVHAVVSLEGYSGLRGTSNYNVIKDNYIIGHNSAGALLSVQSNSNYNLIEGNVLMGDGTLNAYCGVNKTARHETMFKLVNSNNIVRKNIIKDYPCKNSIGLTLEAYSYFYSEYNETYVNNVTNNRIYNNTITNIAPGASAVLLNIANGGSITGNIFKNNAVYNNGGTNLDFTINGYTEDGKLGTDTVNLQMKVQANNQISNNIFKNNIFYSPNTANTLWVNDSYYTLAQANSFNSTLYPYNIGSNPLFDSQQKASTGSAAIDGGDFLTKVTSATTASGTVLTVSDASYFSDGKGLIDADTIRVGSRTAKINSISGNNITLADAIPWTNGDNVSLDYNGNLPDIGAYESGQASSSSTAYSGTPIAIPGTLQVEDFDKGGRNVAYNDDDVNEGGSYRNTEGVDVQSCSEGGYNIGWTYSGEWLNYQINVQQTGAYNIGIRVAADSTYTGGTFHLEFDGVNKTGPITLPATGGWQTWQTITVNNVNLSAGQQTMKLVLDSMTGGNLNYITFSSAASGIPAKPTSLSVQ